MSSIAFAKGSGSNSRIFSVGTYAGSIYLYDDQAPSGHPAGIVLSNCGLCVVGQGKGFERDDTLTHVPMQQKREMMKTSSLQQK